MRSDFVLGVSSASGTLAQLTIRRPVGSALDLGTGCGVQILHLARHADAIVATDVNPRALELAAAHPRAQRGRGRSAARRPVRAGRGRAVRPDHHQPAVRDVAAAHRRDRLAYREGDARRRRAGRAPGPARAPTHLDRGRHAARCWATGPTSAVRTGPSGSPAGSSRPAATRTWCSARCSTPSAYVELWLADAGLAGSPDYRRAVRRVAGLLRPAAASRRSAWAGWCCTGPAATDPWSGSRTGRTPLEQPIGPALAAELGAVDLDERLERRRRARPRAGRWPTTWWRRPPASRAPPTRSTWSSGSSAGSAGRSSSTPRSPGSSGACDGELPLRPDRSTRSPAARAVDPVALAADGAAAGPAAGSSTESAVLPMARARECIPNQQRVAGCRVDSGP